jgi:hypothetical protein
MHDVTTCADGKHKADHWPKLSAIAEAMHYVRMRQTLVPLYKTQESLYIQRAVRFQSAKIVKATHLLELLSNFTVG